MNTSLIIPQWSPNVLKTDLIGLLHFMLATTRIQCLSTRCLSSHTHCKPGTTFQSSVTSTIRDSWRMTHNAVQPCLQCGRLPIFFSFLFHPLASPLRAHTLSIFKPPNYTQARLMYTHSPRANADTWQIKALINSLRWTISPPPPKDEK